MDCPTCPNRRKFLATTAKSLSALALAGPAAHLLAGCGQNPLSSGAGAGTTVNIANSASGVYTFAFADYPALQTPGGCVHASIAATSGKKDVFVTRVDSATAYTVSTVCTHQGCTVSAYDATKQLYNCPCHNSNFSANGAVITGPASTPLPSYTSSVTATGINVTIS